MIGERQLQMMKPTAYLINTCRGGVVDEEALFTALKDKEIAGAALDVTDPEPPSADNPLFDLDNVIITPHTGGTLESQQRGTEFVLANIRRVLSGEPPLAVITAEN
jgi:D-3-phosphoglycerate dehydrogenase